MMETHANLTDSFIIIHFQGARSSLWSSRIFQKVRNSQNWVTLVEFMFRHDVKC